MKQANNDTATLSIRICPPIDCVAGNERRRDGGSLSADVVRGNAPQSEVGAS